MVDVAGKPATRRRAVAEGCIALQAATLKLIVSGNHKKGDVLELGKALEVTMSQVEEGLPIGIDVERVADQSRVACPGCRASAANCRW